MANFVTVEEDKFEKETTYTTTKELNLGANFVNWDLKLELRRIVKMPDQESMLIDINSHGLNEGRWLHLAEGKIIIIADNETITLPANTNYARRDSSGNADESCYYKLGKSNLQKICNCKSILMKVYVGNGALGPGGVEVDNANAFAVYCKLFYNAVYDKSAYTDVVANALGEFTKSMADLSNFSNIKLDGSGANGGCMGMIALMLTLGGAAIGGVCSLI